MMIIFIMFTNVKIMFLAFLDIFMYNFDKVISINPCLLMLESWKIIMWYYCVLEESKRLKTCLTCQDCQDICGFTYIRIHKYLSHPGLQDKKNRENVLWNHFRTVLKWSFQYSCTIMIISVQFWNGFPLHFHEFF